MIVYNVDMYIDIVPNRNSPPAVLLRQSYRDQGKVKKRTIANLTGLPDHKIQAMRQALRAPPPAKGSSRLPHTPLGQSPLRIVRSLPHGHVKAVLGIMQQLDLPNMIAAKRCPDRDLVVGMIVARILFPSSKLDTVARWRECSLPNELGIGEADENDLYAALDWLLNRQRRIEKKLAKRHLSEGAHVLYDLSSSYYTGSHCSLAEFGHSRDGKKGFPIIVYGVLTDSQGRPIALEVYAGNRTDPTTVADQAEKLRKRFGLKRAVLVGDRGSITNTTIEILQSYPGLGWIGALRSDGIRGLIKKGQVTRSLFDKTNLAEIVSDDYPHERLVVCYNPLLADKRTKKREALLEATERRLKKLTAEVARRTKKLLTAAEIGVKAGRIINHYKVAKHFALSIADGSFHWQRDEDSIAQERQLDGIYIIRTSEAKKQLSADDLVRTYKSLAQVEQGFRCLKSIDLHLRPIHLRTEEHVRAHIFLCLLSYYVDWHLRQKCKELLYADEELEETRWTRDPVLPAQPSSSTKEKKITHHNADGLPVQTFSSLIASLATLCRNTCYLAGDQYETPVQIDTEPTQLQQRVFELLGV